MSIVNILFSCRSPITSHDSEGNIIQYIDINKMESFGEDELS